MHRIALWPIMIITACMMIIMWTVVLTHYLRVSRWPITTGTVQKYKFDGHTRSSSVDIIVGYSYTIDGKSYSAESIAPAPNVMKDRPSGIRRGLELMHSSIAVYYNPLDPSDSSLSVWSDENTIIGCIVIPVILLVEIAIHRIVLRLEGRPNGKGAS